MTNRLVTNSMFTWPTILLPVAQVLRTSSVPRISISSYALISRANRDSDYLFSFCHFSFFVSSSFYICGIKNPNLDDCIIKSVAALSKKLAGGIPELNVPPTDPMLIGDMALIDIANFKATGSDVTLSGLLTYHINSLHLDLEKHQVDIDLNLAEAKIDGNYNITARILIPINGRGPLTFTTSDVNVKLRMLYNLVEHAGKQYLYFSSMTTHLNVKDYTIKYEPENFDETLRDAFREAVGHNNREILEVTRPNLEKAISQRCLEISNKICKHFPYEELFPDRE